MMRCTASLLSASGAPLACVMESAHTDSHLAIDGEGNLFRWDDLAEVAL